MALVNEIIRATVHYTVPNSSAAQNVFFWLVTGATIPDGNVVNLLSNWLTLDWGDEWASVGAITASISRLTLQVVQASGAVSKNLADTTLDIPGATATGSDAAAVSGLITTPTATPKTRGRKFVPGIADQWQAAGLFTSEAVAALVAMASIWRADIADSPGGGILTPVVISTPILAPVALGATSFVTDVPAYQRRRKPNVGA